MESDKKSILEVHNLKKHFLSKGKSYVKAVDGVSLQIKKGETLGIIGESGCGKSTLAKLILKLLPADEGRIYFKGGEITALSESEVRKLRKDMQVVFQDPFNSLDPRFKVSEIVKEGLVNFISKQDKKIVDEKIKDMVNLVGLPLNSLDRFPHEFSGGQRQRISLARSLILNPSLLILDEPVSSLDVSIQAQIINLFLNLQKKLSLTYMFIAHDLDVVRAVSDRVCVMYKGKIVEKNKCPDIFQNPLHPYTKLLVEASRG